MLADPEKHWRTGYSARTLAHCWEASEGLPPEITKALGDGSDVLLRDIAPVLAVPEFKVPLPGGDRASQNDVFVLARSAAGPVVIMVEGKVAESFGPTLDQWQADKERKGEVVPASEGKKQRLQFLLRKIGIAQPAGTIRYQLLHRAASAVITAEQYRAVAAVLLVHSFSEKDVQDGWTDYVSFVKLFGVDAVSGQVQQLSSNSPVPLFAGWVAGDCAYLAK